MKSTSTRNTSSSPHRSILSCRLWDTVLTFWAFTGGLSHLHGRHDATQRILLFHFSTYCTTIHFWILHPRGRQLCRHCFIPAGGTGLHALGLVGGSLLRFRACSSCWIRLHARLASHCYVVVPYSNGVMDHGRTCYSTWKRASTNTEYPGAMLAPPRGGGVQCLARRAALSGSERP